MKYIIVHYGGDKRGRNMSYKKTDSLLCDYNIIKARINKLQRDLKDIEYIPVSSVSYDGIGGNSSKISKPVEQQILSKEKQEKKIEKEIKSLENIIHNIDQALNILDEKEKEIIRMKYMDINNIEWYKIAYEIGYSEGYCKSLRKHAVNKISKVIYG